MHAIKRSVCPGLFCVQNGNAKKSVAIELQIVRHQILLMGRRALQKIVVVHLMFPVLIDNNVLLHDPLGKYTANTNLC